MGGLNLYILYSYFIHFICTANYYVSILTRACCSLTFFPQLPKDINPGVLDPDIDPDEVSRDNTITEEFASHPHCRICWIHRDHILQPPVLFVNFQQGCRIHYSFLVTCCSYPFFWTKLDRLFTVKKTSHHAATFTECNGLSRTVWELQHYVFSCFGYQWPTEVKPHLIGK